MDYGYVRVSSKDQNVERQLAVMKDLKIPKQNIFIDRQSGKDFNRPLYKKLLRKLRPGDTLFVKSIDRLGRNYEEIIEEWRTITSFGRPPKEIPKEFDRIYTLWKAEKISGRESAKQLGTTHNTFFKWVRQAEEGRS